MPLRRTCCLILALAAASAEARTDRTECPAPMERQLEAMSELEDAYISQVTESSFWRDHPKPWDRLQARAAALGFGFSQELAFMRDNPAIQPCVWMAIVRLEGALRDEAPIPSFVAFRGALNGEWDWRLMQRYQLEPKGPFFLDLSAE